MRKIILIFLFINLFLLNQGRSQLGIVAHSSNIHDPRLMFVNPAGMGMQKYPLFTAGYKIFYVGIDGDNLSNGFTGFCYPTEKYGAFGITGQYFRADILRKNLINLSYALTLFDKKLIIGVNLGLLGVSYNSSNFHLVDENDPLLGNNPSKNAFNISTGILVNPVTDLFLGISLNNLNQPDLSLAGGENKIPIAVALGLIYDLSFIRPFINWDYEGKENYFNLGLETWFLDENAMLRGAIASERLSLGAAYRFKNFRFDYEYEYALSELNQVSSGFHQFMVSYYFKSDKADFTISVIPEKPADTSVKGFYPGETTTFQVIINPINGFDESVVLKTNKLPKGIKASFNPLKIKPGQKSICKLKISEDCAPNDYSFDVIGESGSKERSAPISLKANPFPRIHADVQSLTDTLIITEIQEIQEESPLLPYIFFKDSSDTLLSNRYQVINPEESFIENFSYENLTNYLEQYRNILNIIAKRLRENPDKKIKLIGCNCDWGAEQGDTLLSRKRALVVKDYLVKNCGILESQIKLEARNRPENASSNKDSLGREENRRVEIIADSGSTDILDPLIFSTTEIQTSDSVCLFSTGNSIAAAGIQSWQLSIQNDNGQVLRSLTGNDSIPALISWDWKDSDGKRVSYSEAYHYRLKLTDKMGQSSESNWRTIYTRYQYLEREVKPTKKIEKIRLILFKFDKDNIDVKTERLQQSFKRIVKKLENYPEAEVIVEGHTDIIGSPEYNMKLSLRRAKTIYQELVRHDISESRISYEGYGQNFPVMDNHLPEGRMMNRRVEIEILYPEF